MSTDRRPRSQSVLSEDKNATRLRSITTLYHYEYDPCFYRMYAYTDLLRNLLVVIWTLWYCKIPNCKL